MKQRWKEQLPGGLLCAGILLSFFLIFRQGGPALDTGILASGLLRIAASACIGGGLLLLYGWLRTRASRKNKKDDKDGNGPAL